MKIKDRWKRVQRHAGAYADGKPGKKTAKQVAFVLGDPSLIINVNRAETSLERWKLIQAYFTGAGRPDVVIDGKPGPQTLGVVEVFLRLGPWAGISTVDTSDQFDKRTEKNLKTLLPSVEPIFRRFVASAIDLGAKQGIVVKVISGNRTWDEQNKLYAQGRTQPGNKVTNARGGHSNHNYGIAIDLGLFDKKTGEYLDNTDPARSDKFYQSLGKVVGLYNLKWGGTWKKFPDGPHFQYITGLSMTQMRKLVQAGKSIA